MKQEELKSIANAFAKANNKDGFVFVNAASILGIEDQDIEDYFKPEMSPAQLFEVLASLVDGLGDEMLKLFALKSDEMDSEEMKRIRMKQRNDAVIEILAEGIQKCDEMLEQRLPDAATINSIKSASDKIEQIEKRISKLLEDKGNMATVENKNVQKVENKNVGNEDADVPEDTKETAEEAVKASMPVSTIDYVTFVGDKPVLIEKGPVNDNKEGHLKLFKSLNKGKIVDNDKRAKEAKKALSYGLNGKQLEALIRAIRQGVSADFIKYYAKKDAEPDRLDKITDLYLALYDPDKGLGDIRKADKK